MSIAENLAVIAENVPKVYNAGYEKGKAEGGGTDTFLDEYLQGDDFVYRFAGLGWKDTTFILNKDIQPKTALGMFSNSGITDLAGLLQEQDRDIDFSKCTNIRELFYKSIVTKLGVIDLSSVSTSNYTVNAFRDAKQLRYIEKIVLPTTSMVLDSTMFSGDTSLTHVIFEGTIYRSFTINASTLDLESAKSVLLALESYAGTDKEFSYTITLSAGTWAVLDADGTTSPNGNTWREYVNDIGWNIG